MAKKLITDKKSRIMKVWDQFLGIFKNDDKIVKFKKPQENCSYCTVKKATWVNKIVTDYACDDCIPRGCSCRLYKKSKRYGFCVENYQYETDQEGKDLPCEDWDEL